MKVLPGRKVGLFLCLFAEASVVFWHSVKEVGLLDEVVEEFQNQLQEVLKGLHERVCDPPLQVKGQEHRRYAKCRGNNVICSLVPDFSTAQKRL